MIKTVEELVVECEAEIEERGLTLMFEEFRESADKSTWLERKLVAAQQLLESNPKRVVKNNGRADNAFRESADPAREPAKEKLKKAFQLLGLSEDEAIEASKSEWDLRKGNYSYLFSE